MYKVSLIVPIYNTEKYIGRCIDSIFSQSIDKLQVIFLDDGSKDNSLSILKDKVSNYQKSISDSWDIVIVSRENKGVSETRQEALALATGEYIAFLDSDDYTSSSNWLEDVYTVAKGGGLDLVISDYTIEYPDRLERMSEKKSDSNLDCIKYLLLDEVKGYCWNKLYRREIIENNEINFPNEINFLEDFIFNIKFLLSAKKIDFIKGDYVVYNQCNVSSITKKIDQSKIVEVKKAAEEISKNLKNNGVYKYCEEGFLKFKLSQKTTLIYSSLNTSPREALSLFPETNEVLFKGNISSHFKIAIFLFNNFGVNMSILFLKIVEFFKSIIK